jgi:hypothetical protein
MANAIFMAELLGKKQRKAKGHCTFVWGLTYRVLSSKAFAKYIEIQSRI